MLDTENPADIIKTGKAMFENDIRPRIPHVKNGMAVAIDVTSGDYEIDIYALKAGHRLKRRRPDAVLYTAQVGYPTEARAVSIRLAKRPSDY